MLDCMKCKLFSCIKLSETTRIYKDFMAFNIAVVLLFASYDGVTSTASTLNQTEYLGLTSQFIINAVQLVTAIVLPQIVIEIIGNKYTLVLAQLLYLSFFAANIYPRWSTLIPTSILVGFANALFWTNLGIYFTMLSKRLAYLTGRTFKSMQTFLFGMFGSIFLTNYILASLWIGFILETKNLPVNATFDYSASCGSLNCPNTPLPKSTSKPTLNSVYILFGTLTGSTIVSILIVLLFVDDLKFNNKNESVSKTRISSSSLKILLKTEWASLIALAKCANIWLLAPVAIFLGFELTFVWYEFNRAFVSCIASVKFIGWVNMVFGACASIFSAVFGMVTSYLGMQSMMILMLMTALGHCIFMISWTATNSSLYVLFLMGITFAFTDSLATSQVRAVYGIFFPDNNAVYSALFIFETVGLTIGSIISIFFCVNMKIYFFIGLIILGIITYSALEIKASRAGLGTSEKIEMKETGLDDVSLKESETIKTAF